MNKSYLLNPTDVKQWLMSNRGDKLAVDTETTSLNYDELKLLGVSLCNGKEACYIDLSNTTKPVEISTMWAEIKTALANTEKLIFHSAPFDLMVLWKYGLKDLTTNIFCTKTAAHLLNENRPTGLKYLAEYVLKKDNVVSYKDVEHLPRDSEEFYSYGADDAIYTWELHELFAPKLQYEKLDKLFYDIEMPFQFSLLDLAVNGVLADHEGIQPLREEVSELVFDLQLKMVKSAGLPFSIQSNLFNNKKEVISYNFDSPKQLIDIITNKLGIEITETTDKGALNVNKDSLLSLQGKHEFIDLLLRYNKASDFMQKYLIPFDDWIQDDGRIRTDFKNTGTVTGRLSSSKPNLQNSPRSGEF